MKIKMENASVDEKINTLADLIAKDYDGEKAIDAVLSMYNDNAIITELIEKIKMVVYPGYYKKNINNKICGIKDNINILLKDIYYNLSKQVSAVLDIYLGNDKNNARSEQIVIDFLNKIPKIREYLNTDIDSAFKNDPAASSKTEIMYTYPGLFAIFINRIAHELYLLGVPLIPRMMTEYAHSLTGIDIHPGVSIGKYFFIDHGTGVVIGETSVIGNNVKIYHNVTLGALSTKGGQKLKGIKRHPTICDNVTIYAGTSVLGGKTIIGENTTIGGGLFITKSVPPNVTVSLKNLDSVYTK